ncbi:AAA domain-containing protein [Pedobacter gandavensis]|uniref:AAA family ATPase n=1 Tax=Pedobacter gandavensis TaxID=2679963 RepID=A0ABR6EQN9_9SPHI|nr:AAA domain-containing protein [Pedobacter gandavensis]MBB2147372.1 AAA family ATPase [Pedobacter gandavensis]
MRIKDIRQFRTFYKDKIRKTKDTNRDEHFVGAEIHSDDGESMFGFFDLYHGDKVKEVVGGIKGFLEGFLEMAQDAQAVYEFMQNAVDANSSHFTMIWGLDDDGEHYLLVLNNGKTFDFPSIRSILNVGVSTKKAEDHTIGKFGIGFKLAHRLVGKDNGIDELLNKNYGPILFSWQNSDIKTLMESETATVPTEQIYKIIPKPGTDPDYLIEGEDPWLFKILITNFPTHPDERIRDAHYKETENALTKKDVDKLRFWLNKHKSQIPIESYQTGSLFFLKLGEDKSIRLEDENLREGIRFSLSILNHSSASNTKGLNQVHLNGIDIENAPLSFEDLRISKLSAEYNFIRFGKEGDLTDDQKATADKDSDIQLLMGYTDYQNAIELIDNVPNFYLFFPLSEEKHKLKFILHSNAFYKKSARTSLHADPLNERLLEVFAKRIIEKMTIWSQSSASDERKKFLTLYPVLILSAESEDHDRKWINTPLVKQLHRYLKSNVPVLDTTNGGYKMATNLDNVRIKKTQLNLDTTLFGMDLDWFYWGDDEVLSDQVKEILHIEAFNVLDLLFTAGASAKINQILLVDPAIRQTLMLEINEFIPRITGSSVQTDIFKENFHDLDLFDFQDGCFKSINTLRTDNSDNTYLLLLTEIESILPYLQKAGFITTKTSLSAYSNIQDFIRKRQSIDYNDYRVLNQFLSLKFEKTRFSPDEKHAICKVLEQAKDKETEAERNQRMGVLRLFANRQGDIIALEQLLINPFKPWQSPLVISIAEDKDYLHRYMVDTTNKSFTGVVIPLWGKLITDQKKLIRNDMRSFFEDITSYQEETKQSQSLSGNVFIPLENTFVPASVQIFYQSEWKKMPKDEYVQLTKLWKRIFGNELPEHEALPYLKLSPFTLNLSDYSNQTLTGRHQLMLEEVQLLAKACHIANIDLFERVQILQTGKIFMLNQNKESQQTVWCGNNAQLKLHISNFHPELSIAPDIIELKPLIAWSESDLANYLIEAWDGEESELNTSLSEVIKSEDDEVKINYLSKFRRIHLDIDTMLGISKLANAVKISLTFDAQEDRPRTILKDLVEVTSGGNSFNLNDSINLGGDSVYFGDSNEYVVKVSDMFESEETGNSKYVERIIKELHQRYQYDTARLNYLFEVRQSPDKSDIISKLNQVHNTTGYLANAEQVAFVLLYSKFEESELDLSDYCLYSQAEPIVLEGSFAISFEAFDLFEPGVYIDQRYHNLRELLKLGSYQAFFKARNVSLFLQPVIENSILLGPKLSIDLSTDQQISLLEFLLKQGRLFGTLKASPSWVDILGFDPSLKVATKFAWKTDELLPDHVYKWNVRESDVAIQKQKRELLAALGVNFGWSAINKLRSALIEEPENLNQLEQIELIHPQLLANTLKLLVSQHENFILHPQAANYHILRTIIKLCIQNIPKEIPVPINPKIDGSYCFWPVNSEIYYYDRHSQNLLQGYPISLQELLNIAEVKVYDATFWGECPTFKDEMKEIEIERITNEQELINAQEWSDPFYVEWQKHYPETKLFYFNGRYDDLYINEQQIKTILSDEYHIAYTKIYCPRKFSFASHIEKLRLHQCLSVIVIDKLEELFTQHNMRIMDILNNQNLDENTLIQIAERRNELEAIAHRNELRTSLLLNTYSYKWFRDFIELQTLQDSSADRFAPEKEIQFFAADREPGSEKLIRLKDPNRTVTPTIEYCTNFTATVIYQNGKETEIDIQDVSKKGQVVLAMVTRTSQMENIDFTKIKRIVLRFSRSVDLLGRLLAAFKRMAIVNQWEENYNLKEGLSPNINFIFGPPGTGKTTTIAKRVIKIMDQNPGKKILILTPTNKAADVLVERILQSTTDSGWLVRYGSSFSKIINDAKVLYDSNTFRHDLYNSCVLATTIHRLPYEEFLIDNVGGMARIAEVHWDYVIFDECSMIPLSYIIYALHQCNSRHEHTKTIYWISGDPLQIPPVVDLSEEDIVEGFNKEENIYTMIGLESFNEEEQSKIPIYGNKVENLKVQYRSVEQIGSLFGKFSYHDQLEHARANFKDGRPCSRPLPKAFIDLGIKPITLLRFPVNDEDSVYKPARLAKSPYQLYSAILTYEIVKYLEKHINKNEPWTVGIVCPYRSQATLVNKMIESLDFGNHLTVIIDTVHGFQGDECDMVFFIVNPPNHKISHPNYNAFIHKKFLINVAISRAKDYLIILYPDHQTEGIHNLQQINRNSPGSLESILRDQMNIDLDSITVNSEHIEQKIFSEKQHIEKNTFTNQHQLVNIYAQAQKKYVVRESYNAIDMHFQSELTNY